MNALPADAAALATGAGDRRGAPPTVGEARRACAKKFRARGIESPELDARILLGFALSLEHASLAASETRRLSSDEEITFAALSGRRLTGEPVARIVGTKEFWSLPLCINASTLVPRPETETIVEAALAALDAAGPRTRPLRVADLGTGCGAIVLALLSELPDALGIGTDISFAALQVARGNARRLGLNRAQFAACDMASALCGPFDLIVSNPPYIRSADVATLAPEVRDFEPRRALDGGADGLSFYRLIAATAPALLAPNGVLIVEVGAGQREAAGALLAGAGLALRPHRPDLNGVPRALVAGKMA